MTPLSLYRQQAAREQDAAETAVLENVRGRSRRAADAWTKLALQIEHTDELRAKRHVAIGACDHTSAPNENSDRGRATSSRNPNTSTKLAAQRKKGDSDG